MTQEKIIVNPNGDTPLNGMLTLPETDKPCPAVVFVHGSGGSDMDSKVYAVRPFKDLAEGLAARGIASIRHDKRTFVISKEQMKTIGGDFTIWHESIEDALQAANMLRNDPRVDPNKVFLAGLSLGGHIAPRIHAQGGNFAGLIIMAGTPRRLEDVMKAQAADQVAQLPRILKGIAKKQTAAFHAKLEGLYDMPDEEAKRTNFLGKYNKLYYLKDLGKKTPEDYLQGSTTPVFVMQGDGDFHVSVEEDFNDYRRILANHPDATFKLYAGLNHVFMPMVHGKITKAKAEYSKPQQVVEDVIEDIAQWVMQR
ncbi:MAG: alpha/beta fold hydrolase [Oscillospiraceae bacterium]|nr:alpha/beta fold hydrolase [Oscillospiraceae bacterium]